MLDKEDPDPRRRSIETRHHHRKRLPGIAMPMQTLVDSRGYLTLQTAIIVGLPA